MAADRRLDDYQRRRDLRRSGEPRGATRRGTSSQNAPRFVVQHHAASRDHYDFRLEVDGVLKSWAVPKGPSTDPRDKQLAVATEDHPVQYADFEGTIPAGQYGGGTVLVWDTGTYHNTTARSGRAVSMADGLDAGHVSFRLEGRKLSGGYALTRLRTGTDESWLLVKQSDRDADARRRPLRTRPESVLSGRSMDEIADAGR